MSRHFGQLRVRTGMAAVLVVVAVLSTVGCDPDATGPAGQPSMAAAPSPVPPSPPSPSGSTATATATATYDDDVQLAVQTIVQYWQDQFSAHQRTFTPVRSVIPYSGSDGPMCGKDRLSEQNAAYCDGPDFIGYDAAWLRTEWHDLGDTFVYYMLGHEYGHAVQHRLSLTAKYTIKAELQADCFAGAYLGTSISEHRLTLSEGDLRELFKGVGTVADQPGVRWFDTGAHGSALERRTAFFSGYFGSVRACTTGL